MKTLEITDANIRINESCHIYDTGTVDIANIVIGEGIQVGYCFVAPKDSETKKYYRHIAIGARSTFTGTGVIMNEADTEIITEIVWDNTTSTLDLLALATDDARISVEGVARVASPYRQVSTRVDQTNILIGTGARVRGVPRLEIATDDIEWGHSCRMHRLGGESLFYLTSRGLTHQSAETLLLNSEILRHLRTIDEHEREKACEEIHMRLIKKPA
jgi:Fe-S cluster assembly scaffold protein SufB